MNCSNAVIQNVGAPILVNKTKSKGSRQKKTFNAFFFKRWKRICFKQNVKMKLLAFFGFPEVDEACRRRKKVAVVVVVVTVVVVVSQQLPKRYCLKIQWSLILSAGDVQAENKLHSNIDDNKNWP